MSTTNHWTQFWSDFHAYIDTTAAAESPNNIRPCPECGVSCPLVYGRHKKMWRWHHPISDCINHGRANWQQEYRWALEMDMFLKVPLDNVGMV